MMESSEHLISAVEPGSIASDLGLQPGDFLLRLDGEKLIDIFDYRLRQLKSELVLTVRQSGRVIEYEIEKDEDEDIGLAFANPMLQDCTSCSNHCLFCFIDQLPDGLRSSLYFKDDDLRLSFLSGNYATLTNLTDEALDRLIGYRFSPMNISVHTTHPVLRQKMIRHPRAGLVLQQLRRIAAAGLQINCQIVLCPELNDGPELDRTLTDLIKLGEAVGSIALVPVGITRYRRQKKLYPLQPYSAAQARMVLEQTQEVQQRMLAQRGTRLLYAADEFYLTAGWPLPPVSDYEDFPQLENGVGMASLLKADLDGSLAGADRLTADLVWQAEPSGSAKRSTPTALVLATGVAAASLLEPFAPAMGRRCGCPVSIAPVVNRFFGETVTVAGLLTGRDLAEQLALPLKDLEKAGFRPGLLLPSSMFRANEPLMLDDTTVQSLSDQLRVPVLVSRPDGKALVGLLDQLAREKENDRHG